MYILCRSIPARRFETRYLQTPLEAKKYCENRQLVQQVERRNANAQKILHCRNPLIISSGTQLCHRSTVFQSPKFKKIPGCRKPLDVFLQNKES